MDYESKNKRVTLIRGGWLLILTIGTVTKIREDQRQNPGNNMESLEMTAGR